MMLSTGHWCTSVLPSVCLAATDFDKKSDLRAIMLRHLRQPAQKLFTYLRCVHVYLLPSPTFLSF